MEQIEKAKIQGDGSKRNESDGYRKKNSQYNLLMTDTLNKICVAQKSWQVKLRDYISCLLRKSGEIY